MRNTRCFSEVIECKTASPAITAQDNQTLTKHVAIPNSTSTATATTPLLRDVTRCKRSENARNCWKASDLCGCATHLGLLYALLSAFCCSAVSALVKGVATVDPAALAVARFLAIFLPSSVIACRRGSVFPRGQRATLILRSLIGIVGLMTKFYAIRLMPLADMTAILMSAPVFVAVFARLFLKEPFTWINGITILGTMAGILLIVRPPILFGKNENYSVLGPALAATSTTCIAIVYIQLRRLKDVHYSATLTVYSLIAIPVISVIWIGFGDVTLPSDRDSWLLIAAIGAASLGLQFFCTKACQLEDAGPVAVVDTTEILFAVIWQVVWFGKVPGLYSWLGIVLVLSSVLLVAAHKWFQSRKRTEDAPADSK